MYAAASIDENVPAIQLMQVMLLVEPIVLEYVPGAQPLQTVAASTELYMPALHLAHALLLDALDISEKVPGEHLLQLIDDESDE